jgi:hypothetical protein
LRRICIAALVSDLHYYCMIHIQSACVLDLFSVLCSVAVNTQSVNYYKMGLDSSEFDSTRELALAVKKQGLNLSELALHFRLYNYFIKLGAAEKDIESFIVNVSSSNLPHEKIVEYVNQLFAVSREQTIPPDQVPNYIEQKLEEKKRLMNR